MKMIKKTPIKNYKILLLTVVIFTLTYFPTVKGQTSAGNSEIKPTLTIPIWPGVAPGSEDWTGEETERNTGGHIAVSNVTKPTLMVYLPEESKAVGTGVIIAPGGGFRVLMMDYEGTDVATWLVERGIAGIVLKYRTAQGSAGGMDEAGKYGIADGIEAMKVVREHAEQWSIDPNRIGFMGFSAGAMVTSTVLLQEDTSARPNFAAPIYGGPFGIIPEIPANLPPVFLAWAQDDTIAGNACMRFYESLKAAGNNPELHIFSEGAHGFQKKGTSSDHWIDIFYYWMEANGWTKLSK